MPAKKLQRKEAYAVGISPLETPASPFNVVAGSTPENGCLDSGDGGDSPFIDERACTHSSELSGSLNPIFLFSGPSAGVLNWRSGLAALAVMASKMDDDVYHVLENAWNAVGVPADLYWRSSHSGQAVSSQLLTHPSSGGERDMNKISVFSPVGGPAPFLGVGSMSASGQSYLRPPLDLRLPDPHHLYRSFYASRVEAMTQRGYESGRGLVIVAVDRPKGKGSKLFNVLSRCETPPSVFSTNSVQNGNPCWPSVACFIASIPRTYQRNLYIIVDEEAPVDPFFDIDCSFAANFSASTRREGCKSTQDAFAQTFPWWSAPCDPTPDRVPPVSNKDVEMLLYEVICYLKERFEELLGTKVEQCLVLTSSFQKSRQVPSTHAVGVLVDELEELKLSFHIHFRLHNREALASIQELHLMMSHLRRELDAILHTATPEPPAGGRGTDSGRDRDSLVDDHGDTHTRSTKSIPTTDELRRAKLLRQCIDFSVYSRWRAFRLPYNVKNPMDHHTFTVVDAAGDEILMQQLRACGVDVPSVDVGAMASALVASVSLSADPGVFKQQQQLLQKMSYMFRFLLPVVPGVTHLEHSGLKSLLESLAQRVSTEGMSDVMGEDPQHEITCAASRTDSRFTAHRACFVTAVTDLALIQRDHFSFTPSIGRLPATMLGVEERASQAAPDSSAPVTLLRFSSLSACATSHDCQAGVPGQSNPFSIGQPRWPNGIRTPVTDVRVKALLAEVFACLSPEYGLTRNAVGGTLSSTLVGPVLANHISGNHIRAQYEEAIRSYHVQQKQSKYCLRQNRCHRSTYAQLYLTYGSIKIRCYSNDCFDRCLAVHWMTGYSDQVPEVPGYPRYDRLQEIRDLLFPPLPPEELLRRYGPCVLRDHGIVEGEK